MPSRAGACRFGVMRRRVGSLLGRYAFDVVIVGIAAASILEFVLIRDHPHPDASLAVAVPTLLAMTLPLLARRRFPFGAPAVAITSTAALSFLEGHIVPQLFFTLVAGLLIAFMFGYLNDRRHAVAGLFVMWVMAYVATWADDPEVGVDDAVFVIVVFGLAWLGGVVLHNRLARARETEERLARVEREREERARAAVAEERSRIARELHDVVGHHVSVMTVQAGAVRRLLREDQDREREALEVVEQTGREALAEMRRMVGVLRRAEDSPALAPQPSLEHVQKLIDQTRDAGLAVELDVEGEPLPLPAGLDLTAYRLVQEGLTNALKHADARTARVLVRYDADAVEVVVDDDGRGEKNGTGGGHGLVGMRERVSVYGGELEAGTRPGGGFRLRARLPLAAT
jgi:signal transduction histidine kinase